VVTRVCVCVCVGSGRGCPLVVHYLADLQSVHVLRCYGNTRNAWQSPAIIRQAHRTPHALRMPSKTPLASDNAFCLRDVICNEAVPFRPYCGGVVTRTRNVSEHMLVLTICLVVKAAAPKQQISKSYPQIQPTDAFDDIYVSQWLS